MLFSIQIHLSDLSNSSFDSMFTTVFKRVYADALPARDWQAYYDLNKTMMDRAADMGGTS